MTADQTGRPGRPAQPLPPAQPSEPTRQSEAGRPMRLRVNGRDVDVHDDPLLPLSWFLREKLRLTSVRETCAVGVCGTCTVLLDGAAVSSCLTPVLHAAGREVTTVEGVGARDRLDPVQQAFVDHQAFQCSFCTPGFVLGVRALLEEQARPDRETVDRHLGGHLCRCGSYEFILAAIEDLCEPPAARRPADLEPR
jgi:aerobic-type carbon monoxide dehydrogenase small subunit (CoxS/CutS family)